MHPVQLLLPTSWRGSTCPVRYNEPELCRRTLYLRRFRSPRSSPGRRCIKAQEMPLTCVSESLRRRSGDDVVLRQREQQLSRRQVLRDGEGCRHRRVGITRSGSKNAFPELTLIEYSRNPFLQRWKKRSSLFLFPFLIYLCIEFSIIIITNSHRLKNKKIQTMTTTIKSKN